MVNVYLRNTGRSPAKDVFADVHVVFGKKARLGCFAFVRDFRYQSGADVIGVGAMSWSTGESVENDMAYAQPPIPWTGEEPILVYVVIKYRDIFGAPHRSKTCATDLPSGRFAYLSGQSWMDY